MMHLGQSKNKTLDEWFRLEPVTGPDVHAQLRLLLHLRRDAAGDKEIPPQCFQQLCQELLPKPSEDLQSDTPLDAKDGPAPTGFPAEIPAGADASEEAAASQSLASELEALQRLCLSLTRAAQPETPQPPRGPEPVDEPPSPLKDSEPSIYDEARAQLLAQKEALERERSELNSHWSALQADQSTKQEVLAEMRAERLSIFSSVEELQAEVEDATAELKEAQAVSSSRLAVRRQLQAELNACAENFSKEAACQRRSTEALRVQRASLRCEAVELGRELQGCVGRGDELVSENLRLRTEAASLEEAEGNRYAYDNQRSEEEGPKRQCRFCGKWDTCEFGRDEEFCSSSCYIDASKGVEALDWDRSEAASWLHVEGLDRWKRQLVSVLRDGHCLLTTLNEGVLRRVGVPKRKAKEVMHDVEDLRRGAWAQPEPPREEVPLPTVTELGSKVRPGWQYMLKDDALRSYSSMCRNAVPQDLAWRWYEQLRTQLQWQDLCDERYQGEGKHIPRRTIFTVFNGCSCVYKYSGVSVKPTIEPDFVAEIRKYCVGVSGLATQPNCCNINLYRDGRDSVGWHTDDEELFEGGYKDITILSLSLGATRTFEVKKQPGWITKHNQERTRSELQRFLASDSMQLQAAALRCRQLWIGMQHGAARNDSLAEGLDYEARLQTLREAADRISCSNGVSTRLHQKPRSSN
ncbi:ALKBH2 [Symbiodinium sp. CCMP2592]|nr:ALKBH2 [Symbiodinium sp. CCMP2592]